MSTHSLATVLRIGGYTNIIGSPLVAIFYRWLDTSHGDAGAGNPVWVYSFFYCTTLLGLIYIHAARDPAKYQPFIGIAVLAKLWGIAACLYAAAAGYPWLLLVGVYDIGYGVCFFTLYRRIVTESEAVVKQTIHPPPRQERSQTTP